MIFQVYSNLFNFLMNGVSKKNIENIVAIGVDIRQIRCYRFANWFRISRIIENRCNFWYQSGYFHLVLITSVQEAACAIFLASCCYVFSNIDEHAIIRIVCLIITVSADEAALLKIEFAPRYPGIKWISYKYYFFLSRKKNFNFLFIPKWICSANSYH